jgi:non-specific serine/threonine protein kinase/serine/threonine-protein kinase
VTPERWRSVKQQFQELLEQPAHAREAWIATAAVDDPDLARELHSLLDSHNGAGEFLETPALAQAENLPSEEIAPGTKLGIYRVVQKIGEGGMSVVYQAIRDDDQFRKLVAVKVLKRGMDTEFLVQRFHNERQILAHFDHPNIAKLLDGGTTSDGRPYFVMEFIAGDAIDAYCDAHHLPTTPRLQLFLKVCAAVEYAHQNLVVHRDLKPRNILVTDGEPKLLDFGIAKLLADDRDYTECGMRVMTPDYASPEQVEGAPVTTASDVYSLGVILCELLTGKRPAPRESSQQFKGDLDYIVAKALRPEPGLRYASVSQLSADIKRHLDGEPVSARTGTFAYRATKFAQRHRMGVAASLAVFFALAMGVVIALFAAHTAREQRRLAERRFELVRSLARSVLFEIHDSIEKVPGSTQSRELLVRRAQEYLDNLAAEGADNPSLEQERAEAYLRIGDVWGNPARPNLGNTRLARENYEKSRAMARALTKEDPKDESFRASLAAADERICAIDQGQGDFRRALESCAEAVELRRALASARASDRPAQGNLGYAYQAMAAPYFSLGEWNQAEEFRKKALGVFQELAHAEPANDLWRQNLGVAFLRLAGVEEQTKEFDAAKDHAEKAIAIAVVRAAEHPEDTALQLEPTFALQRLGSILIEMGDLAGAREAFEHALPIRRKLAALDPRDARARLNLANNEESVGFVLLKLGDTRRALEHYQAQQRLAEDLIAQDPARIEHNTSLASAYEGRGSVAVKEGRCSEARQWFDRALKLFDDLAAHAAVPADYAAIYARLKGEVAACQPLN